MSGEQSPPLFSFHDCGHVDISFAHAFLTGMKQAAKAIPCRFLYDERGSQLFEDICDQPEYYPTRTETAILRANAADIAKRAGPGAVLIELGSGSSTKTPLLLDAFEALAAYVPIDISGDYLRGVALEVARSRPDLRVAAIAADYSRAFDLPDIEGRRVGFFPGSTVGNLTPTAAIALLRDWRARLGKGGLMIVGADMKKDVKVLEAAYNDAAGVSEQFIRNIFDRANRELGGNFDQTRFAYEAHYNSTLGRIEMHLRSLAAQSVTVEGETIAFAEGELIHVENSHKYDLDEFRALAREAGYEPVTAYTDEAELFSVHVLQA